MSDSEADYVELEELVKMTNDRIDDQAELTDDYVELAEDCGRELVKDIEEDQDIDEVVNPWKDVQKCCQPNYSVPKSLAKLKLPPSPPSEKKSRPRPPSPPKVDVLKIIEDNSKVRTFESMEVPDVRLNASRRNYVDPKKEEDEHNGYWDVAAHIEARQMERAEVKEDEEDYGAEWGYDAGRRSERLVKHTNVAPEQEKGANLEIDYLDFQETYDLIILQTQKMRLPQGIDKSQLQLYLTPGQFESAFKMSPDMFKALPLWRKTNLKKSLKLF